MFGKITKGRGGRNVFWDRDLAGQTPVIAETIKSMEEGLLAYKLEQIKSQMLIDNKRMQHMWLR